MPAKKQRPPGRNFERSWHSPDGASAGWLLARVVQAIEGNRYGPLSGVASEARNVRQDGRRTALRTPACRPLTSALPLLPAEPEVQVRLGAGLQALERGQLRLGPGSVADLEQAADAQLPGVGAFRPEAHPLVALRPGLAPFAPRRQQRREVAAGEGRPRIDGDRPPPVGQRGLGLAQILAVQAAPRRARSRPGATARQASKAASPSARRFR